VHFRRFTRLQASRPNSTSSFDILFISTHFCDCRCSFVCWTRRDWRSLCATEADGEDVPGGQERAAGVPAAAGLRALARQALRSGELQHVKKNEYKEITGDEKKRKKISIPQVIFLYNLNKIELVAVRFITLGTCLCCAF